MKRLILFFFVIQVICQPLWAETADAFEWEKIAQTEKGDVYYLDRKGLVDSIHENVAVKKATIKVTNFTGIPDVAEFFGVFYLRCDPAGWRPLLAGGKRISDGKMFTVPVPPPGQFAPAPDGSPLRLTIDKACTKP